MSRSQSLCQRFPCHGVISRVLDEGGHDKPFVGPVSFISTVEGVPDIDAVEEGVVRVDGDES